MIHETVITKGIPTSNTINSNSYSNLCVKVGGVGGVITLIIIPAFIFICGGNRHSITWSWRGALDGGLWIWTRQLISHDGSLDADARPRIFTVRAVSYNDGKGALGAGNMTNDYLQSVMRVPEQSLHIRWNFAKQFKSQIQIQIQEKLRLQNLCCLPIEKFQQQDNIWVHPST